MSPLCSSGRVSTLLVIYLTSDVMYETYWKTGYLSGVQWDINSIHWDANDTNGTGGLPTKRKPMVLVAVENCWDLTTDLEPLPPPPPTLEETEGGGRNISHLIVILTEDSSG